MATSSLKYLLFITVMLLISTLIIIYSDGYDSHIDVRTANISNRDYNKLQNLVQSKTSADSTSIFSSVDSYSDGNSNSVNSARIQQKISNSQVVSNRAIVISDEEKTPPTVKPTEAVVLLSTISSNCSVTSDIFGNLGEPNVVTNGKVDDWLKDRWQSARNMQGTPVRGPHWLEIDLQSQCKIESVVIDWEKAYSKRWKIEVRNFNDTWHELFNTEHIQSINGDGDRHMIQIIKHSQKDPYKDSKNSYRYVRLLMLENAYLRWAASVWRLDIIGYRSDGSSTGCEHSKR